MEENIETIWWVKRNSQGMKKHKHTKMIYLPWCQIDFQTDRHIIKNNRIHCRLIIHTGIPLYPESIFKLNSCTTKLRLSARPLRYCCSNFSRSFLKTTSICAGLQVNTCRACKYQLAVEKRKENSPRQSWCKTSLHVTWYPLIYNNHSLLTHFLC